MKQFRTEFNTLRYIIEKSNRILLFAHSSPDGDTVGSVLAMQEYLKNEGKVADVACLDPFPEYLKPLFEADFQYPDHLDFGSYEAFVACDSVERGFHKIFSKIEKNQTTVLIDHHPDISLQGDVNIVDADFSSVCEIVYNYFIFAGAKINQKMATALLLGIFGDTGIFQHSNTTAKVMEIASDLMKKGAPASKITEIAFANKNFSTLKLWGRAFEQAKINPRNGMIATVVTQKDLEDCGASSEDLAQVASILNTVPGTKFSLILSEREGGKIKGSLRSEEYKGVDVSAIAHLFGGGGHKLASGFELKGKIVETADGWEVR
jgi:phosphoesterase RecJ-like protein